MSEAECESRRATSEQRVAPRVARTTHDSLISGTSHPHAACGCPAPGRARRAWRGWKHALLPSNSMGNMNRLLHQGALYNKGMLRETGQHTRREYVRLYFYFTDDKMESVEMSESA
eukprot:scaffold49776_cov59-Phaeocystis_antarctica.AAC.4